MMALKINSLYILIIVVLPKYEFILPKLSWSAVEYRLIFYQNLFFDAVEINTEEHFNR